jgi:2-oxoisovalerate dehydrogenase E1 component alpha subunit
MFSRVHFPGAVNSKFTTRMAFEQPSTREAIPTYRVMDSEGVVVDKDWKPDASTDEILTWYRNMLIGKHGVASRWGESGESAESF